MNTGLVLIDIQKDYFPGGRMEVAGSTGSSEKARILLGSFRSAELPIFHIQHISTRKGAIFFLPKTDGIEFNPNVKPTGDEVVITKHYPNSFRDTNLENHLSKMGVETIVFCGMMSHMCVDATVRAAFDKGYDCMVAHDACAAKSIIFGEVEAPSDHVHAAFMGALGAVYAKVLSAEEIADETTSK